MNLIWTQEALSRLENIQYHLSVEEKAPEVAHAIITRIVTRVPLILDMPFAGKKVPDYDDDQVREIQENPYRIIYYLTDDAVYILSVMHHRQLIPNYNKIMAKFK